MSSEPFGLGKIYAPMEIRVFVPFDKYNELSLKNVKCACEEYFQQPKNVCTLW